MSRLMKKDSIHIGGYCPINYDIVGKAEIFEKLGQLENIEDKLGIDLITLFKAEEEGFYYKNKNGEIYYSGNQFIRVGGFFVRTKPCYQIKETTLHSCYYGDVEPFKEVKSAHYWDWEASDVVKIKDYGKTWAFTEEELENV